MIYFYQSKISLVTIFLENYALIDVIRECFLVSIDTRENIDLFIFIAITARFLYWSTSATRSSRTWLRSIGNTPSLPRLPANLLRTFIQINISWKKTVLSRSASTTSFLADDKQVWKSCRGLPNLVAGLLRRGSGMRLHSPACCRRRWSPRRNGALARWPAVIFRIRWRPELPKLAHAA